MKTLLRYRQSKSPCRSKGLYYIYYMLKFPLFWKHKDTFCAATKCYSANILIMNESLGHDKNLCIQRLVVVLDLFCFLTKV